MIDKRVFVSGLIFLFLSVGVWMTLVAEPKPTTADVDKYFQTQDARLTYSFTVRALIEAQSLHRPIAPAMAFVFKEGPTLAVDMFEGGPAAIGADVGEEVLFSTVKSYLDHPESVCMNMANSLYDQGLKEYRANYAVYKKYKSGQPLTETDKQGYLDRRGATDKLLLGKDLFADVMKEKYQGTEWEQTKDKLLGKLAETQKMSKTLDRAMVVKELTNIVTEAKSGLKEYSPYQKHLERVKEMENQSLNNPDSGSSGAPAPGPWAQVAGGGNHTLARKTDNTLWAWGYNNFGQLSDGTTVAKSAPVQIAGTTWAQVACGYFHTLARKTDNTLWAWGRNNYGQLGDGTTVAKSTPTQVGQ